MGKTSTVIQDLSFGHLEGQQTKEYIGGLQIISGHTGTCPTCLLNMTLLYLQVIKIDVLKVQ